MECAEINLHGNVNNFLSIFGFIFEKMFVKKDFQLDSEVVLRELQKRELDVIQLKYFMDKLPSGEWTLKIFIDNIESLTHLFGISDEFIRKCFIKNKTDAEIDQIKWQVLANSMLEYTKFSNEYYDALKYNNSSGLSISKIKLLNELMMTFKLIKEKSKELYEKYHNKKYSKTHIQSFNLEKLPIEFLVLRMLYIALNIKDASNEKLEELAKLLSLERISLIYHKNLLPRYN